MHISLEYLHLCLAAIQTSLYGALHPWMVTKWVQHAKDPEGQSVTVHFYEVTVHAFY